jgi:hypothetical protein
LVRLTQLSNYPSLHTIDLLVIEERRERASSSGNFIKRVNAV